MKKSLLFSVLAIFILASCGQEKDSSQVSGDENDSKVNELALSDDGIHYGEKITDEGAIPLANLVSHMEGVEDSLETKVYGKVTKVCMNKGCWMTLETDAGDELFVQFKDYSFFMPFDIEGKEVVLDGKAYSEYTPVDELQHYAEDLGKSQEEIDAITEPKSELKFYARGVIIRS